MSEKGRRRLATTLLIGLFAIGSGLIWAQAPPERTADHLVFLKRALAQAEAQPLSLAQAQQLNALMTGLQNSRQGQQPSAEVEAARTAYDNALLAGDTARAAAQAAIIANATAASLRARLEANANFVTQVLNILRSNGDQIALLQKSIGNTGLLRLISTLGGGPGGGFGGGPGGGPGRGGFGRR